MKLRIENRKPMSFRTVTLSAVERFVRNLIFGSFLFVSGMVHAQISTSVDTTNIRIGEEIKYSIEVVADSTDLVLFPEGQSFLPLEMIESYKVDTTYEQAKFRLIKRYGLTQFDSGAYVIPPQRIAINDKVYSTDSIFVEVADVVVDTTKQKMFNIKPATDVGSSGIDFVNLLYWLIPILLLAAIAWYFFRKKKLKEAQEIELPPYEEALVSLKKLDESNLLNRNRSKDYYSQLTEIVKRYLDREIDETALECTSDELIERLQLHKDAGNFDFNQETIQKLDQILKRADLAKFAKLELAQVQASADRNDIEEFITDTHEAVPEPTEEELLQNEIYAQEQRRKRRQKRIVYGSLATVFVLIVTTTVFGFIYGWGELKDNVIGHPTKDLVEGQWYRSEYGIPAVVLETPFVLKRIEVELPPELVEAVKSNRTFAYGSVLDRFYVVVSSTVFSQPLEGELDASLEASLRSFEAQGAKNLLVKKEGFETEKGVKGLKAYGSFESENPFVKGYDTQNYEMFVFGQQGALQQVIIAWLDSDPYAEQMIDRIRNSIELEVQLPQQAKK